MSRKTEIIEKLRALKPVLKERYGIEEFALFGSVAKGVDTESSDIDIAITKMKIKSGFDIVRAQRYLSEELGKKIDLGTFNSMRTFVRNRIEKDLVHV